MAVAGAGPEEWSRIKSKLRAELGEDKFASWFARVDLECCQDDGTVRLSVPTVFLKTWIHSNYRDRLVDHWRQECTGITNVEVSVRGGAERRPAAMAARIASASVRGPDMRPISVGRPTSDTPPRRMSPSEPMQSRVTRLDVQPSAPSTLLTSSPLDPRHSFASFVDGRSNQLALAAARQVAESKPHEPIKFNPLYIQGSVGLGKTHLLQAIAQTARETGKKVLYLTAENFLYRFVSALASHSALAFKESLRGTDLLLIDDMQFLQGPKATEEFCHALNSLIDGARQVVIAADRAPSDLESLDERVRSRLAGGLLVEIGLPDAELRRRILAQRFAQATKADPTLIVSPAVLNFIADNVVGSGRDLDGAVNRILAHHQLTHEPIGVEMVETAIKDLIRTREPKRVKIEDIQRLVAKFYQISKADLLSERRNRTVVLPRQIAMYLAKTLTMRSLPEIGRRFGGRDHTTVLHAVRKIDELVKDDAQIAEDLERIKRQLNDA